MQFIKTKSKQALYLYVLQHKFQPSIYQCAYLLILIFLILWNLALSQKEQPHCCNCSSLKRRLSDFIPDCSGLPPVTHYPVCRQAEIDVIGLIPIYRNRNGKNRFGLSSRFWNSVFVNKKKSLTISCKGLFGKTAAIYSPTINAVPSTWLGLTSLFGMGRGGTPML